MIVLTIHTSLSLALLPLHEVLHQPYNTTWLAFWSFRQWSLITWMYFSFPFFHLLDYHILASEFIVVALRPSVHSVQVWKSGTSFYYFAISLVSTLFHLSDGGGQNGHCYKAESLSLIDTVNTVLQIWRQSYGAFLIPKYLLLMDSEWQDFYNKYTSPDNCNRWHSGCRVFRNNL